MTKIERFEAIDRCLFWKEKKILIIGDLHLAYEGALHEQGWSMPPILLDETLIILKRILEEIGKLNEIILLGDVKHYHGSALDREFSEVYAFFDVLIKNLSKTGKIIIVKGNHDNILEPILRKYDNVYLKESYIFEDILFLHGDKRSFERAGLDLHDEKVKLVVCGHFHPAIVLEEDAKREKYKCFLFGKSKELKKQLLIVPSFFPLVEGMDIREIRGFDIKNFEVFVVGDKVYDFGKAKKLR